MSETVLVSEIIPATRERIYAAWLDSSEHSAFTGDAAIIEPTIGGRHSTFGGFATGTNVELEPYRRIVQTWRSTEFPEGSPDSRLEVTLEETGGGTLVTVLHTEIPQGQADRCREGWVKFYLEPMKRYFADHVSNGVNGTGPIVVTAGARDASEDKTMPGLRVPPGVRPAKKAPPPVPGPVKVKAARARPAARKAAAKPAGKKAAAKAKMKPKKKAKAIKAARPKKSGAGKKSVKKPAKAATRKAAKGRAGAGEKRRR
jgi:uncharacterized protein YndB with AHSA1/START domain